MLSELALKLFSVFNQLDDESGGFFSFVPQKNVKDYEYVKNPIVNKELSVTDQVSRILNSEMNKINKYQTLFKQFSC